MQVQLLVKQNLWIYGGTEDETFDNLRKKICEKTAESIAFLKSKNFYRFRHQTFITVFESIPTGLELALD